jgi:hypothetical protein
LAALVDLASLDSFEQRRSRKLIVEHFFRLSFPRLRHYAVAAATVHRTRQRLSDKLHAHLVHRATSVCRMQLLTHREDTLHRKNLLHFKKRKTNAFVLRHRQTILFMLTSGFKSQGGHDASNR